MSLAPRQPRWIGLGLAFIVLLGAAQRISGIGERGLWSDELFTTDIVVDHPLTGAASFRRTDLFHVEETDGFWTAAAVDNNPPLFELLAKASVAAIGPSDIAVRLPSLIAGILTVLWLALQAWRARARDDFAVYATATILAALSGPLITYSREARPYSLAVFFGTVLTTQWYERSRIGLSRAEPPGWMEIGVLILACHTHYSVFVLSAVFLAVYGWRALVDRRWAVLGRLLVVPLSCIPWLWLTAHTLLFSARGGVRWSQTTRLQALLLPFPWLWQLLGAGLVIVAVLAAGFAVALRRRQPEETRSMAWVFFAGLALSVIFSQLIAKSGIFHSRHLLVALPICYLLAGLCVVPFARQPVALVTVALLLAATQLSPGLRPDPNIGPLREGYREATSWLTHKIPPNSPVVTTWAPNRGLYRYYLDRNAPGATPWRQVSLSSPADATGVCDQVASSPMVGVIAHATHVPLVDALINKCGDRFEVIDRTESYGLVAQLWRHR